MGENIRKHLPTNIDDCIWCICFIQKDFIRDIDRDLDKDHDFRDIEIYIPTINSISVDFHGKQKIKKIPAVFNYGFVKMPKKKAASRSFLKKLQVSISCIYSWVLNPASSVYSNIRKPSAEENLFPYAIAQEKEIAKLALALEQTHIYSGEDIANLRIGSYITLNGYPFDGLEAKVLNINTSKKEVKVEINMFSVSKEITVNFENVFYTVYHSNFQESPFKEVHLEDILENTNQLDSLFYKSGHYEGDED